MFPIRFLTLLAHYVSFDFFLQNKCQVTVFEAVVFGLLILPLCTHVKSVRTIGHFYLGRNRNNV